MLHKDSKSKKKKGSSGEGSIINQVIILTLNFEFFIYFNFYVFFFFSKLLYFLFCFYFNCISFLDSIFYLYIYSFFYGEGGGAGRTKDKFLVFISQLLLLYMKFSCSSTNQKVFIIFNRNKYGVVSGVRKNGE